MSRRGRSAIEIQISARVEAPRNGRALSEAVIREAITRKAENPDEDIPGIDLRIVRWRHGRKWTAASNDHDEWIRFGRFLPAATIAIERVTPIRNR